MKLALVALIFVGPTSRVALVRLKATPDDSCIYIICFGQVQTCLNGVNRSKCVQIKKGFTQTNRQTNKRISLLYSSKITMFVMGVLYIRFKGLKGNGLEGLNNPMGI